MDEAKNTEKKNDVKDKSEKDPPADVVQTVPYDVDAALYEQYMDNPESQWRMEEAAKTQEDEETSEEINEKTQLLRAKTLKLGDEQAAAAKEGSDEEEPAEEKGRASVKPLEKGKGGVVPRAKQKMEKKEASAGDEVLADDTAGEPAPTENPFGLEKKKDQPVDLQLVDIDSDDDELRDSAVPLSLLETMHAQGLSLKGAIASLRNAMVDAPIVKRIEQYKIKKVKVQKAKPKTEEEAGSDQSDEEEMREPKDSTKPRPRPKAKGKSKSKGKGRGRGKAAKAKAKPYAKRKAQKKVEEHEISDESDEEDEDEEEISSMHAKKRAEVKLREAKNAKTKNSEPSSDSELPLPKDSKVEKVTKKKTTEEAPAKKKKTEEKMTEEAPAKKKKKTEEKMTEEAPAKKKKTEEQMTEEAPAKKKKKTEAEAVPDKKKKRTDEAPEKGEPKTFARRPCPKTSPASDRWIAISQTFKKHVAPRIVALGLYTYSYEDRGATKISNCHLALSLDPNNRDAVWELVSFHVPIKEPFLHMATAALEGYDPSDYAKVVRGKVVDFMETLQDVE